MKIQQVTDASFGKYGKVMTEFSFDRILKEMEHTPLPKEVVYVPSAEELEVLPEAAEVRGKGFGGLPIQIGYCNGDNHKLNALEYHRSSEIDIAVTDLILLLGCQQDIEEDGTYDTAKVEAYYVSAGTAVELYATTLHYAPCSAAAGGFRCVVVLPRGTNEELTFAEAGEREGRKPMAGERDDRKRAAEVSAGDDAAGQPAVEQSPVEEHRLLTAVNKWLIAHEEAQIEGAFCGLRGENITV